MGKLSLYARQRIANLHELKKNHFQIANEIREGDNINVSIPVLSFPIRCFNQTGSLHDKLNHARAEIKKIVIRHFHIIDEQMRGNDKLLSIELAFILLAY